MKYLKKSGIDVVVASSGGNFDKVGITAGASTPDWIIKKVADKLKLY